MLKKKEIEKEKPETIGGLTDSGEMSAKPVTSEQKSEAPQKTAQPPPPPPSTSTLGEAKKSEEGGSALSGMDIFTQETGGEDEGNKLAEQLPEVDIQDLLQECEDVNAELASNMTQDE